jgi:hypothetical protein
VLGELLPFGPSIAEHCVVAAGLAPNQQLATSPLSAEQLAALHKALVALEAWFASLDAQVRRPLQQQLQPLLPPPWGLGIGGDPRRQTLYSHSRST